MFKNRGCTVVVVALSLVVVLFLLLVDLYTDVVWFEALGLTSLLWRRIVAEWLLFGLAWLVATLVLASNWWLARRLAGGGQLAVPWLRQERHRSYITAEPVARVVGGRLANTVLFLAAAGLGLLFALPARTTWLTALLSLYGEQVGTVDPLLGRDLSFYLFRLPWLEFLQGWLLWLVFVALAGAALIYLASFSAEQISNRVEVVGPPRFQLALPRRAERHLLILGAVLLGLYAWGYQLDIPGLLYSRAGAAYGAGYTDVHARWPVLSLLTIIALAGAVVLLVSMFVRVRWLPYAVVAVWLLTAFVGGSIYPSLLQRLVVIPNELAREREYIANTIEFTRAAYGLDDITEADFDVTEVAAPLDLAANQDTITNIRLWDYRPLLRTYSQLQEIRTYYSFSDVDVDRYTVDGAYRQVMLAAREIAHDELPATAQTWINRHLVYTHGTGAVVSPVNEVLDEGLPDLWLRDLPPQAIYEELALPRYQIYYGELTDDYVVVQTEVQELDYSSGDENAYTVYEGTGGVVLDSLLKRLAYAFRLGSSQLFLSSAITSESQLLWRRAIDERVRTLAPFLRYDGDPYPVIVEGRLVWMLDAYTVSDRYPYSNPLDTSYGRLNYMRNVAKITMDAYDGSMAFYLIDPDDPIATAYASIFPDLFRPASEMPEALRAHWRYPEGLFRVQAAQYMPFHMTDPQVFYNQEDLWNWPEELTSGERVRVEPYYVVMSLPEEEGVEFILMLPFTPANKQNMIAWLYARNDGENYGQLGVYNFPKQRLVYGPMQVESRIDQDPEISEQLTLWNQRGSQVIRGNLLVIPIDEAILYVEPIYLQAEASQLPELRRVIVVYGSRIAMEETLAAGLVRVMSGGPLVDIPPVDEPPTDEPPTGEPPAGETPAAPVEGSVAELAQQADEHYQAAQDCLRTGDWLCHGQEMEALEQVLEALLTATEE